MGRAGARRVLWGLAVVGAVLVPTAASGSTAAPAETIDGAVLADGTPQGAPGRWMVSHPAPGVYRIVTGEPRLTLDVPRWDVVADVTILPLGSGAEEVRFTDQGLGVDSDFSFTATIPR